MGKDVFAVVSEQNSKFKPVNQDCAFAGPITNSKGILMHVVAVADGISGASHGEKASLMAITAFCKFVAKGLFTSAHELAEEAHAFFLKLNKEIAEIGDGGSGTTFTAMVLFKKRSVLLHIGDSRAYFLSNGHCKLLTKDHTEVAEARERGVNEDEIALMHQHALTQCLGIDADCEPDVIVSPIPLGKKEGLLVLTTDGVHDVLSGSNLITMAKETEHLNDFCKAIVKDALVTPTAKGTPNRDNITMAVVRIPQVNKQSNDNGLLIPAASTKIPNFKTLHVIFVLLFIFVALVFGGYYVVISPKNSVEIEKSQDKYGQQLHPTEFSEHQKEQSSKSFAPVTELNEVESIQIIDEKGEDFSITLLCNSTPGQLESSQIEPEEDGFTENGFRVYYDIKGISAISPDAQNFLKEKAIVNLKGLTFVAIHHHQDDNFLRIVIRGSDKTILSQGISNKTDKEFSLRFVTP